jgi:hypothetical protein
MRLTHPRITVRRLMIVVAIVGITFGLAAEFLRLRKLSLLYRERAAAHGRTARLAEIGCRSAERLLRADINVEYYRKKLSDWRLLVNWHERMIAKYERAACYPWHSVAPDLPKPTVPR